MAMTTRSEDEGASGMTERAARLNVEPLVRLVKFKGPRGRRDEKAGRRSSVLRQQVRLRRRCLSSPHSLPPPVSASHNFTTSPAYTQASKQPWVSSPGPLHLPPPPSPNPQPQQTTPPPAATAQPAGRTATPTSPASPPTQSSSRPAPPPALAEPKAPGKGY